MQFIVLIFLRSAFLLSEILEYVTIWKIYVMLVEVSITGMIVKDTNVFYPVWDKVQQKDLRLEHT